MSKQVVAKNAIPLMARDLQEKIEQLLGKEVDIFHLEPFAKIFLQLKAEYEINELSFTSYPNDAFCSDLILQVLEENEQKSSELLLELLSPFVAEHSLSDFSHFGSEGLPEDERKALYLRQHIFPEMLDDFDRDLKRDMPEYGEEEEPEVLPQPSEDQLTMPLDIPDDLLEEDMPELRQGAIKVERK